MFFYKLQIFKDVAGFSVMLKWGERSLEIKRSNNHLLVMRGFFVWAFVTGGMHN